jgi:hypothetical protein
MTNRRVKRLSMASKYFSESLLGIVFTSFSTTASRTLVFEE